MLKRVVLYDISKDMFKKNIKVFGDIKPTIQLFIHYNNVIDDYLLDELPDNVHIITSAITTLNPKIVCLTNNQTLPINISWDPRLNSTTSLKQLEKAYLPSTISFNFDSNKQLQRKGIDLSTFRNVKIKNLIIQSDCFTISSTCDNLPIEKLTIERSCTSIYLGKTRVKYLVVYSADYISVNSSLETIEFKSGMLTTIKSEKEKKELTIIVNLNKMLTINNITTINFSGHGFVTPVNIDSTTIHSDSVCFAKHVDDNSFLNLQTLTFKNCKCNTQLDFKTFICPRLLHLSFTNCKFQKIYFPNNLQTLVYDNTTAKLYDVQNLPIKLQSMFDENV